MGRGGLPFDLRPALAVVGQPQAAVHLPAGGEPGFSLQIAIELHAVFQELRDARGGSQLAHKSRRVPRAAAGQFAALQQQYVFLAKFGKVKRGTAADDAAADDDDFRAVRDFRHV